MKLTNLREKPFYLTEGEIAWVSDTLSAMTVEEKAGQLFCVLGTAETPESLRDLVQNYGVAGVLFRPGPQAEIREKYAGLDSYAKLPLLKAANLEEGGAGVLSDGTYFGSQLQVAAADDLTCTEAFAKTCALEGRSVGVNWTFSPVVDIDVNFRNPITNVRTFGSDPDRVLANASAFVRTIQKYGIAAACKHFPGDGVDFRDQHLHPTYNDLSAEDWFATYGRVYQTLIDEGLMSIMVGHIVQPNVIRAVNPQAAEADLLPGSQSKEMLTGVLRERFGFNGVIITDATIMGGYTMTMPRREAIPRTIMAGCDMLCFGTDIREDISYVLEAVSDGRLSRQRLDEAVTRVLALKAAMGRDYPTPEVDARAEQRRCADRAVTLVKDTKGLLPATPERYPNIRLVTLGKDETFDGSLTEMAADFLTARGFRVERYDPMGDDLHGTRGLSGDRLTLLLCNLPAASNQTAVRIRWCDKHALEIPRFVNEEPYAFISFANPYHLQDIPRVPVYINAYTATAATITAALEKLTGQGTFTGVSPIDPFCGLYDAHL
ncbi:MAG: glycosyl hydrolase family 3 [Oscillospiraceae bacterium]|nr:glycosyl hydrolase family 3 [Oscillospiraceae bacterium]